jgi:hypothetical protein
MPITKTRLVISHVVVAVLSSAVTLLVVHHASLRRPTAEEIRHVESYLDQTRCFGNARSGLMNTSETSLFERLRELCAKGNVPELNRLLAIEPGALDISCVNNGQEFKEPTKPLLKYLVKNISSRPVPILEPNIERGGYSTQAKNREWTLDYSISDKNQPSWVRILEPGQQLEIENTLEPEGYGGQKVQTVFFAPVWKSITNHSLSKTTKVIYRGSCTYKWVAR